MLQDLNQAQRQAVQAIDGPVLVLAGAGSGKTRVITYRIAHLIARGIRPERILAVTFTNKAAGEMQQRAAELIKKRRKSRPFISTFHALCVNILRSDGRRLGYPARFTIYDRNDQEGAARAALRDIQCPSAALRPGDLVNRISQWKMKGRRAGGVEDLLESEQDHLAASAYRRYETALRAAGALDFDDLLLCTDELFHAHPEVLQRHSDRFDHVLVDEYQDTNATQFRIVSALVRRHGNLCVVGDDDQSIYAWRGADVSNILEFDRTYRKATIVHLEENYRSVPEVLDLANRLIRHNPERRDKTLRSTRSPGAPPRFMEMDDEVQEAKWVVGEIGKLVRTKTRRCRDIAVLFRTNEQPRLFESELRAAQIPYVLIGGMSFFDRREVRDLLAYLKILVNPEDEVSLLRVLNRPARGIGESTTAKLLERAVRESVSLWKVFTRADAEADGTVPARTGEALGRFREFIETWQGRITEPTLVDGFRAFIQALGYRAEIERSYKEPLERLNRWRTVEELVNAVGQYEQRQRRPSLGGFLEEVSLAGREQEQASEKKLDRDAVVLMTLHSAKGLEFPAVYLVGMEEGLLPHERTLAESAEGGDGIAEERRLAYVGITRARDVLTICRAQNRTKWGKRRPTVVSRFVGEMRGDEESSARQTPRSSKRATSQAREPKARRRTRRRVRPSVSRAD